MWFAAVCSLMWRMRPISRFERPRASSTRISSSRALSPSGSVGDRVDPCAELVDPREKRRHPDRPREPDCDAELGPRALAVAVPVAREQHPPVLVGGVRQPGTRAEPRVEGEGRLEVLLRALPLPEDGRVHPEVAVGGAVAGDEVPDHRVRARVRQELAIEGLRERLVAEHGACVGEVHERRDPQRRPQRADPVPDQPAELAARVVDHAELREDGDEAWPPRAVARRAAEEADDRRDLREPTLLAPDAEHLDAVRARRVPRGEEPSPLVRSHRRALGRDEVAVAELERGAVVLRRRGGGTAR